MRTLIVIASPSELELVRVEMERRKLTEAGIVITGVGGLNVVRTMKDFDKDCHILNIGYAGSANIPIDTRVEVGSCCLYHPNVTYPEPSFTIGEGVMCYTSNDFVLSTDEKDCVFDMELVHILNLGFKNVESVKYVSDNCNYEEYVNHSGNQN